ncbi:ABC transporter permease [Paenibacillus sp. D2_2]|uniref:ABC transporter permease n=1 Tax=Paenibacillus sp. D2_2 TaxID=3073092 RepID=UPI002814D14F|nr:ABC transporter permease [Paenibacillus sp. D2_2]WMT41598.1 ABC transporter permease [Paenibacillus sp. D2_2]
MLRAISLALLQRLVAILFGAVLLTPVLWRVYGMEGKEILILFTFTYTMNAIYLLLFNLLAVAFTGFRRILLRLVGTSMLGASYMAGVLHIETRPEISIIILLCYVLASVLFIRGRISIQGRFEASIREEERQRTRLTGMILQPSVERPVKTRPRPWLFRRSGHLIRHRQVHDRVTEAAVKSFFRNREVLLYVQFAIYGFIAVFLPPYPANLLVYIGLILLLFQWMNTQRRAFYQAKLLAILPKDENLEFRCAPKTMRLLLFPAILVITAGFCMNLFTPGWGCW